MTDTARKPAYTKSRLVRELSWKAEMPQRKVKELLAALTEIACREARDTFVLPGLCKFVVVRRKTRKIRNPRTGEVLVLPEHDALRIVAARAAKLAVAPKVAAVPLSELPPPAETPVPAPEPPPVSAPEQPPASAPTVNPDQPISFRCPRCGQEIEAPGDMVGIEAECPTCGNIVTVPAVSESGTIHAAPAAALADEQVPAALKEIVSAADAAELYPAMLKNRTIRISAEALGLDAPKMANEEMVSFRCPHCHQEVEASLDMAGEAVQCPNCAMAMVVPRASEPGTLHFTGQKVGAGQLQAMKSRTMRIDMPDNF